MRLRACDCAQRVGAHCTLVRAEVRYCTVLERWNLGWVLVDWTGLVLSATQETAPRLVYRSAALVAFLP